MEIKFRIWNKVVKVMSYFANPILTVDIDRKPAMVFPTQDLYLGGYEDEIMLCTELTDISGDELYTGDITQLELQNGEVRIFEVAIKTVIRDVVCYPNFDGTTAKVAITGVVFLWNGYELFPCVDGNGECDNTKMKKVGNKYENPELLDIHTTQTPFYNQPIWKDKMLNEFLKGERK